MNYFLIDSKTDILMCETKQEKRLYNPCFSWTLGGGNGSNK